MTTLRAAVDEYLAMRRNLGFRLCATGRLLHQFVAFMEHQRAGIITTQLAMAWAQQSQTVQPAEWARRLSIVRIFARHRHATDPRTEIPPAGLLPYRPKRARPYVYSDEEIRRLVHAARTMSYHYERGALRPWVYSCLLGLLSVSGMRLGDARNLELPDIDLPAGVLTIRGAKFGKTRLVPLHPSVCTVLADYLRRRHQHWKNRSVSSYVFVSSAGNRLDVGDIHRTFYVLSRQIGLRGPANRRGPRIHDLRHRFAVKTLWRWYRTGDDPERRLPVLSAYLGHVHIRDTYWYLSAWPELMREAMRRVEQQWEDRR